MKSFTLIILLSYFCYFSKSNISLTFSNDLSVPKYPFDLKEIFGMLFSSRRVCIWTEIFIDHRVINVLKEIHKFHNYSVTLVTYGDAINSIQCMNNIVFNLDYIHHKMLFKDEQPSLRHVFLDINTILSNVEEEPKYKVFKIFSIAKVIVLTEYQVYKISTPYFPPRQLQKVMSLIDLEDEKVTDLKGSVVNIPMFNCSLFSILNGPINSGNYNYWK